MCLWLFYFLQLQVCYCIGSNKQTVLKEILSADGKLIIFIFLVHNFEKIPTLQFQFNFCQASYIFERGSFLEREVNL